MREKIHKHSSSGKRERELERGEKGRRSSSSISTPSAPSRGARANAHTCSILSHARPIPVAYKGLGRELERLLDKYKQEIMTTSQTKISDGIT